ncbi:hypothetical protein WJX84_008352 [Apatococcus fuscideae]|uniref:RRM domain-containing protein n=1 Tax=Apatococcus fuscideae TaxID=2026836 RepID=A0AAW1SZ00_9CHLO
MEEQLPAGSDVASSSQEAGSRDKLFLGGLSWETNEEKVRRHFEKYGELQEVVVMRDRMTGKPRGFGFVTFKDKDAAERVCQEPQVLDGRQIDAKRSVPQEQKPRSKKIFVGGLAPDTDEDQFQEYFERYGKVTEAQIMQDHTSGRSRGFGFITFEDESSVEQCFAAGSMHQLGNKRVEVKTATPRGSGPMPRPTIPGFPTGARPLFPGGRPAFPGFPGQLAPGVMGAYGMGTPYAYNPYANMMMGGFGFPPYAYGPQYAGQAAAIAAAAAAQQQQQQQQQGQERMASFMLPPHSSPSSSRPQPRGPPP